MTNEIGAPSAHAVPHTELTSPTRHFTMRFSSTPRGARLARRLAGQRLDAWGVPYGSAAHDEVTLVVAELCANAVRHGRVPGRDFRLWLGADAVTVRVEVTDTRAEGTPEPASPGADGEGGRGLLIVAGLAATWGWREQSDGPPGKTVWAEYSLRAGDRSATGGDRIRLNP
ncbi:ATP-binding protein [Streptomyces sp. NPDC058305]|uniref:ATP-binding protein n=1 Tax=Streptomyces sp. NPDC058305 TaxID=3346438 RepID=UPI0036F038C7